MEKEGSSESKMWRWLVNLWTLLLFALIITDIARGGTLGNLLGPVAAIYVAALAIYSAEKEFGQSKSCSNNYNPKHRPDT